MTKFKYLIILMCFIIAGCLARKEEEASESVTFPTGELLTNESFLINDLDIERHNRLYFQASPAAKRELIADIFSRDGVPISLSQLSPKLYKFDGRIVITIGYGIYKRIVYKEGRPQWHSSHVRPDQAAGYFLRTYLRPGDPLIPISEGVYHWDHPDAPIPKVLYNFDNIDLSQNIMVTKTTNSDFPEYLIFSSIKYQFDWQFDLERTLEINRLKPRPISNYTIDFSVITYPGTLPPTKIGRDDFLAFPGAKEIHFRSDHLKSDSWVSTEYSFSIPNGTNITERYEAILGFLDPSPGYLSVFWRRRPDLPKNWLFVKTGEWTQTNLSDFAGGITRVAFFRVRNDTAKAE